MDQKKIMEKRKTLLTDYRMVFGTPEGRNVLHDLMKHFNVLSSTLKRTPPQDPLQMAFNEGGRNAVLFIMTKIKMDPKKLEQLIDQMED